jgi:hypothetical protein
MIELKRCVKLSVLEKNKYIYVDFYSNSNEVEKDNLLYWQVT